MKLLVIEDDVRMAGLLRRGLSQEGWAVDVAGQDAVDARHAVESTPYDAVVCDVGLPGDESGLDWCRWFRDAGHATPVLMLTARTGVDDRIAGLDCGADDYLGKPFAFGELAARLRALLRRGETARPTTARQRGPGARPGGARGRLAGQHRRPLAARVRAPRLLHAAAR